MGLAVLAGVVVMLGLFVALSMSLGIGDIWVSFLFALYWSGIERANFAKLAECIVGAIVGLGLAWGLQVLPAAYGTLGTIIIAVMILAALYCLIVGWLPLVVNYCNMLFLTVGTVPAVQAHTVFSTLLWPLGLGILYFVGVMWLARMLAQRSAAKRRA
jgi:hypothetical protein